MKLRNLVVGRVDDKIMRHMLVVGISYVITRHMGRVNGSVARRRQVTLIMISPFNCPIL